MVKITELYRLIFGRSKLYGGDVISMAEHGRVGGDSSKQPYKFVDYPDYTVKITESGNYTYIAFAPPGTALSAASWKAFRIDETSGFLLEFADGNPNYDNRADDLPSLNYS